MQHLFTGVEIIAVTSSEPGYTSPTAKHLLQEYTDHAILWRGMSFFQKPRN